MAFINNFNKDVSNLPFKGKLTSDNLNLYLKESSLINYSLVQFLKTYYDHYCANHSSYAKINSISILTEDNDVKEFLEKSLHDFLFSIISNTIVNEFDIDCVNADKNIKIITYYKTDDGYNEHKEESKTISVGEGIELEKEDEYAVFSHKNYLGTKFEPDITNIEYGASSWGKEVVFPFLKVENGHVTKKDIFRFNLPDPFAEYTQCIINEPVVNDNGSMHLFTINGSDNVNLLFVLYYPGVGYISKFVNCDAISRHALYDAPIFFEISEGSMVSTPILLSLPLEIEINLHSSTYTYYYTIDFQFKKKASDFGKDNIDIYYPIDATLTVYAFKEK